MIFRGGLVGSDPMFSDNLFRFGDKVCNSLASLRSSPVRQSCSAVIIIGPWNAPVV